MSITFWEIFAYIYFTLLMLGNLIFTFVVTIGGIYDLKRLFKELHKEK